MGRHKRNKKPSHVVGELEEDSLYFEDCAIDLEAMRAEHGLLSMRDIIGKNLSEDDFSAMLEVQLDMRDSFIELLSLKILDLIDRGQSLEEKYKRLKTQVHNLTNNCNYADANNDVDGDLEGEGEANAFPDYQDSHSRGPNDLHDDRIDGESKSSIDDAERNCSVRPSSRSPLHKKETGGGGEKTASKKGEEEDEKDKFKAMVAMAFEAQGYDYGDMPEEKKSPDDNSHSQGYDYRGISEEKESHGHSSDSQDCAKPQDEAGWQASEDGASIAKQVEAAAKNAVEQSGYVYQEELGLYYDSTSGYYYNAENGLYYDPKTGTYFYYDHETQSYKFHSQVPGDSTSDTNGQANVDGAQYSNADSGYAFSIPENQKNVSPSLRLMVTESEAYDVKVGELHVITISGGKVGRNPSHAVYLKDDGVSEDHAEFSYQSDGPGDNHYFVKDIGSSSGTFINGTCICLPGEPSDEIEIGHGWELQFGNVKLKCHIHPGYLSCNDCEPGVVLAKRNNQPTSKISIPLGKARMKELKALKKKYAINTYTNPAPKLPSEYEDRAKKRRKEKGSDNPYEKTEVASTETELRDTNKGFELLKKMGWSKGQGLGKSQPGILNPIEATSTVGREGLGFSSGLPPPTLEQKKRKKILDVTAKRFNKI